MATGRHSPHSSPSLAVSTTTPSSTPPPLSTNTTITVTSPVIRQQPNPLQHILPPSSAIGEPFARISTSSGSSAVSRSASTALRDDLPDSPRPRKRPRLQSSDRETQMKFESSTSTDLGESSELLESNGTSSGNVRNGIIKEATNGVSSSFVGNGAIKNGSRPSDQFFGHSREEVTRLMMQALNDLGYK